jgi:hypothetical protein
MVLPLIDEDRPKCYVCHQGFENIEELRKHQEINHREFLEFHRKNQKKGASPGDVTLF